MERNAAVETITILGMSCQACADSVERALREVPGVVSATVTYASASARVEAEPGCDRTALEKAVERAGFQALDASVGLAERVRRLREGESHELRRVGLEALVATSLLVTLFATHYLGWHSGLFGVFLALATIAIAARLFWKGLEKGLALAPDMNTLVALAGGTALASAILLEDADALHAGMMIVTFVLIGRWLEARTRSRVGTAVSELLALAPPTARVLKRGVPTEVGLDEVAIGNLVQVRPGERIPVDGIVFAGRSDVDKALVTGESTLCSVAPGDALPAGALNQTGELSLKTTGVGATSSLAQIAEALFHGMSTRAPVQALADRVSAWFVPCVLGLALVAGGVALFRGAHTSEAIQLVVAVLVVACPCALGLATPIALMAASDRATRAGFLVSDAAAFEELASLDTIVFDKTGTLSRGEPELVRIESTGDLDPLELLGLARALERKSEQPLARAVLRAADERGAPNRFAKTFRALPGRGVEGEVDGRAIALMRPAEDPDYARGLDDELGPGESSVLVRVDGETVGWMSFTDSPADGASALVDALRRRGLRLALLSGDEARTVEHFARGLDIESFRGECTPIDKAEEIGTLTSSGRRVAFVGDGINDAPALARAHVSVAPASGSDVAIAAADVTWLGAGAPPVDRLVTLGIETRRAIRQNLAWAFGYNLVALPLASGLLSPWIPWTPSPGVAALAMSCSSLAVVWNGLRLKRRAT